jgi:hypothetical protein
MGGHFQVFIPENNGCGAIFRQHQQPLFKAGNKSCQVFKVTAVLFVGINNEGVVSLNSHSCQKLIFTLLHSGIGQGTGATPENWCGATVV